MFLRMVGEYRPRIHFSLTADYCFDNAYVRKQPVAWIEECSKYWLKCNSSPDKHVFLYLFPVCLCIIIHFSAYLTTIRARVLCLFTQMCKRKNPMNEPHFDLAVILVTSRYEHNTLTVNSKQ